MKTDIVEVNRKKLDDALSTETDIVKFISEVVEYDENASLVIPSPETVFFIARGFAWFLPPTLSRVSNNINIIILCAAAEKYTLRLVEAEKNAKMYLQNNYMTAEQAKRYYEQKRTEPFIMEVTFGHIIDNLKIVKANKNIYGHLKKYKEEMEEYSFNLSFEDKKNRNIFSRNLITGIDIISKATNERDVAIISKFKGGFVRVKINDPYLLNLRGDAATIEMLERIKLDRKLSLQLYDQFSKKGFLIFDEDKKETEENSDKKNRKESENRKREFKDEFSISKFRAQFCINRNDPYVKVAIDNANSKLRYSSDDDLENYYRLICATAKFQKKKYLANVKQYKDQDSGDDDVIEKIKQKELKAAKDVYPYDRDDALIIEIRKACEEISAKTRYNVKMDVVKEILRGYTIIFRCSPNKDNIEKLKEEKEERKAEFDEEYPDIDKMHVKEHAKRVEELRRAYFRKEEAAVEKSIAEKYIKENGDTPGDVSLDRNDKDEDEEVKQEEKTLKPERRKKNATNINEEISDEEIEEYVAAVTDAGNVIPDEYRDDIYKMTRCLMVLSNWNSYVKYVALQKSLKNIPETTPELDRPSSEIERVRVVINLLAEMATKDFIKPGRPVMKSYVVFDRLNEIITAYVQEFGKTRRLIPLTRYVKYLAEDRYKEFLIDPNIETRKAREYLRTTIWNNYDDWKLIKEAENYGWEKAELDSSQEDQKEGPENKANREGKENPRNKNNRFNQFPTRPRDFDEDAKKIFD